MGLNEGRCLQTPGIREEQHTVVTRSFSPGVRYPTLAIHSMPCSCFLMSESLSFLIYTMEIFSIA